MTSIVTNTYTSQYSNALSSTGSQSQTNTASTAANAQSSATTVTLSQEAQAALSEKPFATVIADAHTRMKALLADTMRSSPLEDGKLAVDLSQFERRELFAISSNSGGMFSEDEIKAAKIELQRRFDAALVGPHAVARVTSDFNALYKAAQDYLESMSAEEKATTGWKNQMDAVKEAIAQFKADPDKALSQIEHDPVFDYLRRVTAGEAGETRTFADVTNDARATLDRQYEKARNEGLTLAQAMDLSHFTGRALSAIALNSEGKFSSAEIKEAKIVLSERSRNAMLAAYENSKSANSPTALAENMIAQYGAMTPEEREAAGWTEGFYKTIVSNYQTSATIAQMFSSSRALNGGLSLSNYWRS